MPRSKHKRDSNLRKRNFKRGCLSIKMGTYAKGMIQFFSWLSEMLENSFIIVAAISCNKDVLGSLRGCVLLFEWKSYKKWICGIACISVHLNVMYYNEHSLSNQQKERKVKECRGFEPWFLMQVTRVFIGSSMNVAMSTKTFRNGATLKTVFWHIAS